MTQKFALPDSNTIHRAVLPNGIVILAYETPHTHSVVINGSLDAGALFEDSVAQNGLASLTAAALMRGTQSRDFDALHSQLEDIGADLSVSSGLHKVGFNGKALAEDLPVLVTLLADILRYPAFPMEQVERLRGERMTSLNYLQQDTSYQASRAFREMLYPPEHPYYYGIRGTLATVPEIDAEQMRAFHARHYGPRGMLFVITGAVNPEQAILTVSEHFADWQNLQQPNVPVLPPAPLTMQEERRSTPVPGKNQANILMGVVGPSRYAPDYLPASLGNSALGVFGMMGRIGASVREREGLAYHAGSRVNGGLGPGAWRVSAGVDPKNVERAIMLCRDELRRFVQDGLTAEELADNQSYFVGNLPLQLEGNDGIASMLHAIESYGLGLDYLRNYRTLIQAITAEDVLQAARHYINPDALKISIAGIIG